MTKDEFERWDTMSEDERIKVAARDVFDNYDGLTFATHPTHPMYRLGVALGVFRPGIPQRRN